MLKSRIILCGEAVIRDAESNRISVINLYENISAQAFPAFVPKMSVLGAFSREHGDPQRVKVEFTATLGTTALFEAKGDLNFEDKLNTRFIFNLFGLAITEPGQMTFTFTHANKKLGSFEVPIILRSGPEITQVSETKPKKKRRRNKKQQVS